jgi:DNA-binding NarL/FixJ family response regulator
MTTTMPQVASVLAKLGVDSRTAAAYAVHRGLA